MSESEVSESEHNAEESSAKESSQPKQVVEDQASDQDSEGDGHIEIKTNVAHDIVVGKRLH